MITGGKVWVLVNFQNICRKQKVQKTMLESLRWGSFSWHILIMRDYGYGPTDPIVQASVDGIVDAWRNRKPNWWKMWVESIFPLGVWCKLCGTKLEWEETYSTNSPRSYCPKCQSVS